jgi:SAM-dependent methyltransferase
MEEPKRAGPLYIDEDVTVHQGAQAAARVAAKAAAAEVDPSRGVTRVDRARWDEAQRYERTTWLRHGRRVFTDRNEYHRRRFDDYALLRGRRFARAVELGCGPFTNLRLMLERCRIDEVHLLDPLIGSYLEHPFCRYRGGRLGGLLNEHPARLAGYLRRPAAAWRSKLNDLRIGGWRGRPVTLTEAMIESYAPTGAFDLVVMINVLEHCQDAQAVLERIDRILAPGGWLVFHDKLYDADRVRRLVEVLYDAGHPLRVDRTVVESFLERRFEPLMRRVHGPHRVPRRAAELRRALHHRPQARRGGSRGPGGRGDPYPLTPNAALRMV